ncbi:hypothetical protein ACFPRL_26945 [Pseudoclavibacter helvolus]
MGQREVYDFPLVAPLDDVHRLPRGVTQSQGAVHFQLRVDGTLVHPVHVFDGSLQGFPSLAPTVALSVPAKITWHRNEP